MDILRPSYKYLKFTKRVEVYKNHKRLTGYTEKKKTTYVRNYPFSQILSHNYYAAITVCPRGCLGVHRRPYSRHKRLFRVYCNVHSSGHPAHLGWSKHLWPYIDSHTDRSNYRLKWRKILFLTTSLCKKLILPMFRLDALVLLKL